MRFFSPANLSDFIQILNFRTITSFHEPFASFPIGEDENDNRYSNVFSNLANLVNLKRGRRLIGRRQRSNVASDLVERKEASFPTLVASRVSPLLFRCFASQMDNSRIPPLPSFAIPLRALENKVVWPRGTWWRRAR